VSAVELIMSQILIMMTIIITLLAKWTIDTVRISAVILSWSVSVSLSNRHDHESCKNSCTN